MDTGRNVNNKSNDLLREVRRQLKVSQQELADYLEWDRGDLSNLETGKKIPDWFTRAVKLEKFLRKAGHSLDDLAFPD